MIVHHNTDQQFRRALGLSLFCVSLLSTCRWGLRYIRCDLLYKPPIFCLVREWAPVASSETGCSHSLPVLLVMLRPVFFVWKKKKRLTLSGRQLSVSFRSLHWQDRRNLPLFRDFYTRNSVSCQSIQVLWQTNKQVHYISAGYRRVNNQPSWFVPTDWMGNRL